MMNVWGGGAVGSYPLSVPCRQDSSYSSSYEPAVLTSLAQSTAGTCSARFELDFVAARTDAVWNTVCSALATCILRASIARSHFSAVLAALLLFVSVPSTRCGATR